MSSNLQYDLFSQILLCSIEFLQTSSYYATLPFKLNFQVSDGIPHLYLSAILCPMSKDSPEFRVRCGTELLKGHMIPDFFHFYPWVIPSTLCDCIAITMTNFWWTEYNQSDGVSHQRLECKGLWLHFCLYSPWFPRALSNRHHPLCGELPCRGIQWCETEDSLWPTTSKKPKLLVQQPTRNWILPTMTWVILFLLSLEIIVALAHILTVASWSHLSCTWIPNLQKL